MVRLQVLIYVLEVPFLGWSASKKSPVELSLLVICVMAEKSLKYF